MVWGNWNFIKRFFYEMQWSCVFFDGKLQSSWQWSHAEAYKVSYFGPCMDIFRTVAFMLCKWPCWMPLFRCQLKRKVKKQVEDRKLESKMAGCGQYCWVRLITVHSLGRQSVRVPTIGSWSGWQHGQSWAAFASVPATEGQAYWEAVWWTQWVRQTCCINRLFAAVARNKP